jgi:hypothetical protein
MFYELIYLAVISVAGANLFLLVDRYERDRTMGALLKFLVLAISS